jgi:hypothetical protein
MLRGITLKVPGTLPVLLLMTEIPGCSPGLLTALIDFGAIRYEVSKL